MVGHVPLEDGIGVRIPDPQPRLAPDRQYSLFSLIWFSQPRFFKVLSKTEQNSYCISKKNVI
jgi:hypothetical protein